MEFISPDLMKYCEEHSSPEPEVLREIWRHTHLTQINPRMVSGHLQGLLLNTLVLIKRPVNILEIGTFTGYSAIAMSASLPENGRIHTIEVDEELEDTIIGNITKAGVNEKVILHIGNALDIIPQLLATTAFDMVFMDADKENYPEYLKLLKKSLRPGALLIADNVLWSGKVLDPSEVKNDIFTNAIDTLNRTLSEDPDFQTIILPVRDGISLSVKL